MCVEKITPWFESNWFASIIGAVLSFIFTCIIFWLTNRHARKIDSKNLLLLIMSNYQIFISQIYNYSYNPGSIDYVELRKSLNNNSNILLVLPKDVRESFLELYKIHMNGPDYYDKYKSNIVGCLNNIVKKLESNGVDTFEYK